MTTERHSPEWLIENADHGIAFEVACASALTRLLAANAELQQQLEAIGAGGVGPLIAAPQPPVVERSKVEQSKIESHRDSQEVPFEAWWERHGQFLKAGGGQYEKTFAWHAWCEAAQKAQPQGEQEPAGYEFYNPATGHAILDYSEHTHVGHLTADKGYIAKPLFHHQQTQREDVLLEVIQRLNQNPYSLTKWECIDLIEAMRANGIGGEA